MALGAGKGRMPCIWLIVGVLIGPIGWVILLIAYLTDNEPPWEQLRIENERDPEIRKALEMNEDLKNIFRKK